jgi:hypothetical protein
MRLRLLNICLFVICFTALTISCKKSDPAPLGAQTNAKFLAGDKGKSKSWKLTDLSYSVNAGATTTQTLVGCFKDNLITFTNNDPQDYATTEGASKCDSTDPDAVDSGTWAFTLDGLILNVEVAKVGSPAGIFSPYVLYQFDSNNAFQGAFTAGSPYPAFVKKIDDNNLVLELNYSEPGFSIKVTYTLIPA